MNYHIELTSKIWKLSEENSIFHILSLFPPKVMVAPHTCDGQPADNATTCSIQISPTMPPLVMPFSPGKHITKLVVFSCVSVILLLIIYKVDHAVDNQPTYGLDFHLSYSVSKLSSKKTTRNKSAAQSAQSYGQQCEHPVRLDRLGNYK